jgi:EmrB/QacA subfamily drug resistance transporter
MLTAMPETSDQPLPPDVAASGRIATTRRTRLTAVIVASALLMQNLDSTVLATALPTMARAFGSDPVHMNVALTSYLLSLAVFIPASGWMADRYGARTVFRAAILVFTLGSILCGQANSLGFLVVARILQGMGGAMMVPVGRLVLLRTVAKSELVAAMAWLTAPALIGPVVGPPIGGMIVSYLSWRWIFYINVPIGLLGVAAVTRYIADVREPNPGRFDGWGLLWSGVGLLGLMFGLETVGRGVFPTEASAGMIGVGLVGIVLYLIHARGRENPLLDLSLFRLPSFTVPVAAGSLFRIGIGAIPFLLPLMLQLGFGRSAAQSGMITFASSAGALVMKPATQFMLRRLGFRDTLIWNGLISASLVAACAAIRPGWPIAAIYALLLAGGFVRSLQFTAYNALAYADVPRKRMSSATSLYSCLQQLSLTLGISAGAGVLEVSMALAHHSAPTIPDFTVAFLAVGFISMLASPAALLMPRDTGAELAGRAAPSPPSPLPEAATAPR